MNEVTDSPVEWVNRHIQAYVASDGKKTGSTRPMLLLTTRGRISGTLRRTALYYARDGEDFLVTPSNGGSARHPQWYRNLLADPNVELQVGSERFAATARPAPTEDEARLWDIMLAMFPTYAGMRRKAKRAIPVVVLRRRSSD